MSYFDNDRLKQLFFIALILLLGGTLFWTFSGFIPGLLGAITLYILMRPALHYLVRRKKWKKTLASLALLFTSFVAILLPIGLFVNMMAGKISFVVTHSKDLMNGLRKLSDQIKISTRFDLFSDSTIQKVQEAITNFLPHFLGSTFNVLSTIVIMYFILYFMLTQSDEMETTFYEYIPLKEQNVFKMGKEVNSMVISNAVGIPMLGIVQAIFALIAYAIFGIKDIIFWSVVTGFMSFIPLIGTAAVWVPLSIFLIASGDTWKGVGLLIYGVAVIANLDNVFRFIWQKKMADVHPLITVFGVLMGIKLFGFVGIIFGPLLISMFLLLLKIYGDEFTIKKTRVKIIEDKKTENL